MWRERCDVIDFKKRKAEIDREKIVERELARIIQRKSRT